MLAMIYDLNGIPRRVSINDGVIDVHLVGDEDVSSSVVIDFAHAEIHEGDSFTAFYIN
jgi:hypothetical protein